MIAILWTSSSESAFASEDKFYFPPQLGNFTPTPNERTLLEQGFGIQEYPYLPFGYKHYFYNHDNMGWSDVSWNMCQMSASYPLHVGESEKTTLKFPKDLIWAGSHDTSGFFVGRGGIHTYTDYSGNTTSKNTEIRWEKLQPDIDDEFITIEYQLQDELSHLLITNTGKPEWLWDESREADCPSMPPVAEYDYYDGVNSIAKQRELGGHMGFAPDVYICEGNLIGAIKSADDKPVCVKPQTKEKLIEREWAKQFET